MEEKFACPHCGQHLVITDPPYGAVVPCPGCRQSFALSPAAKSGPRSLSPMAMGISAIAVVLVSGVCTWLLVATPSQPQTVAEKPVADSTVPSPDLRPPAPAPALPTSTAAVKTVPALKAPSSPIEVALEDMKSTDYGTREEGRDILRKMGRNAIPDLLKITENRDPKNKLRHYAIEAIGYVGDEDGPEVQSLLKYVKDKNYQDRYSTLNALTRLTVAPPILLPILIDALADENARVRRGAALGLEPMGRYARDAVPALLKAKEDTDPAVRDAAIAALDTIQPTRPAGQ